MSSRDPDSSSRDRIDPSSDRGDGASRSNDAADAATRSNGAGDAATRSNGAGDAAASPDRRHEEPILRVEGLRKYYDTSESFVDSLLGRSRQVKAVDGVDFELYEGETLGVVGESGCGKSTLGRATLRLVEPTAGSVHYRGQDLAAMSSSELRDVRTDLQYIFQDPFSSLNPRLTVGDIVGEPLDVHGLAAGEERQERVRDLLEEVGLNASHVHRYPHEFSGGQRQRIGIARALAVDPDVIVCDEPVSALDVSVQAQILNLLADLQAEHGLSYVFIAHDLSVVEHIADRIAVMYLGAFAEVGPTRSVFEPPYHPYTEALLSAIPEPDPLWEGEKILLPGSVPSPIDPPSGCRFHTRCPHVIQPEGIDLEQSTWRPIVDLKIRLRDADELEAVTATTVDETADPAETDRATFGGLVREEFGLPDQIGADAERTVSSAIDRLYERDFEGARAVLEDDLESPCEVEVPALLPVGEGHRIACHLYDERFADARSTSAPEGTERASADD